MTNATTPSLPLDRALTHAVTRYDQTQAGKRGYNRYALAQYLARCEDIVGEVEAGATLDESLNRNFLDRLRDSVARYLVQTGHLPAMPVWTNR